MDKFVSPLQRFGMVVRDQRDAYQQLCNLQQPLCSSLSELTGLFRDEKNSCETLAFMTEQLLKEEERELSRQAKIISCLSDTHSFISRHEQGTKDIAPMFKDFEKYLLQLVTVLKRVSYFSNSVKSDTNTTSPPSPYFSRHHWLDEDPTETESLSGELGTASSKKDLTFSSENDNTARDDLSPLSLPAVDKRVSRSLSFNSPRLQKIQQPHEKTASVPVLQKKGVTRSTSYEKSKEKKVKSKAKNRKPHLSPFHNATSRLSQTKNTVGSVGSPIHKSPPQWEQEDSLPDKSPELSPRKKVKSEIGLVPTLPPNPGFVSPFASLPGDLRTGQGGYTSPPSSTIVSPGSTAISPSSGFVSPFSNLPSTPQSHRDSPVAVAVVKKRRESFKAFRGIKKEKRLESSYTLSEDAKGIERGGGIGIGIGIGIGAQHTPTTPPESVTLSDLLDDSLLTDSPPPDLQDTFFRTYTRFSSPLGILEELKVRWVGDATILPHLLEQKRNCIVDFLKDWMDRCIVDLLTDKAAVLSFIAVIGDAQELIGQDLILDFQSKEMAHLRKKQLLELPPLNLQWSSFDPREVAKCLTMHEFELFQKITSMELLRWNKRTSSSDCPNICAMINFSTRFSSWVTSEVTKRIRLIERVCLVEKFLQLGEYLLEMKNFSSCMSLFGGLSNSAVWRMKKTWGGVNVELMKIFDQLASTMSHRSSYSTYRSLLKRTGPPCIPYIGIHLGDLTFIDDGNKDFVNRRINLKKWTMVANALDEVQKFQMTSYPEVPERSFGMGFSLVEIRTEDECDMYSRYAEPRDAEEVIENLIRQLEGANKKLALQ